MGDRPEEDVSPEGHEDGGWQVMNDQTATMKDLTPEDLRGDNFDVSEALSFLMDLGIVTDYADEYGEPGYSLDNEDGFFVIGDWWCKDQECDYPREDDGVWRLHDVCDHYPSLVERLAEAGMETAFHDEWFVDNQSSPSKAYRTTGDSYGWQSSILWCDGDYLTPDDGIEAWIEWSLENGKGFGSRPWSEADLIAQGFTEYQCDYESGWFEGMNDDPDKVMAEVQKQVGDEVDVLPYLKETSQFYIRFCMFTRPKDWTPEDGE